jgi:hypothetical protein
MSPLVLFLLFASNQSQIGVKSLLSCVILAAPISATRIWPPCSGRPIPAILDSLLVELPKPVVHVAAASSRSAWWLLGSGRHCPE